MRTQNLITAAVLAAGLCAGQAWGATITSAQNGFWDVDATWGGSVPTSADDVTIMDTHTVTVRDVTTHDVGSLTIQSGGVLTHTNNSGSEAYKCILNIVSNLTIDAGGAINVDAKGYAFWQGAGPGSDINNAGGSYGGRGGSFDASWSLRKTYGSITSPTNCGSSGNGTIGGGAALLTVGGMTTVNGTISSCGSDSPGSYYGGSGGSVYLRTGTIAGSGTIRANGGAASSATGGGGRIAVILTNSMDFGGINMQAYAGSGGRAGAGGTVYLQHTNHVDGEGKLVLDYGTVTSHDSLLINTVQNGLKASSNAFSEIVLTNGAVYALDTNDTLNIAGTVIRATTNRNVGLCLRGGILLGVPSSFGYTNYFICIADTNTVFNPTSLTVGTNAVLRLDVPWTMSPPTIEPGGGLTFNQPITLNGTLTIPAGGTVNHTANFNTEAYKLDLTINGDLDVQAGGKIDVVGKGFADLYNYGGSYNANWCGGSHGGWGGYTASPAEAGPTYGSITSPTNCGSGGRNSAGGGAALLKVTGTTIVNGVISSDGAASSGDTSGAGGTVYLRTASVSGSGTIRANGGYCGRDFGGGGGRVAVIVTNSTGFDGIKLQAYAGQVASSKPGAAGTVYTEDQGQGAGRGTLKVDANNIVASPLSTTFVWTNVRDTVVGTVIITNKAALAVSNTTFKINGDLENTATFSGYFGSTVYFAGTNAAVIRGSNTFYNLVCTNIGESFSFEDGRTNTVDGVLTLANITLNPISGGQWYLKASAFTHNVTNVTVSWSDARPGSAIEAFASVNGGSNYNWVFAESGFLTNYWTGATDSDWTKPENWSRNRSTQLSDTVVVTNGCLYYPLLQAATRIRSLAVSNGATLGLTNYNLVVDDDVRVAGTLTASGTEKLTIGGDLDFTGGTFNAATSTVWIAGSNAQTVVSDGKSFRNLVVSNSAASVTFTDAVSATNIVNYSSPITFGGPVTAQTLFRTVGTNVIFGGAVTVPSFYNETGALVFSGAVTVAAFTNWAGDLTFRDDVTAGAFYSAPGGMTHTFRDGKTVTVEDLEWYGRGGYPIVLRSASDGNAWNLNVTSGSKVRQVDVKDSNAAGGQTLYPVAATNSGNNTNWVFSSPWQTWVGTVSLSFTNGNNWVPAGAPNEAQRLLIDGYYTSAPVLSGAATALQVVVGGITTATLTVNGELTVAGDVTVIPNGSITHTNNTSTEANKLALTVNGNLNIQAGGMIDVSGKGFAGLYNYGGIYNAEWAGGSHGGWGGYDSILTDAGPTYDSITYPTNCGSGGRSSAGGGAALLKVTGTTTVNGAISADGAASGGDASGAGGSVYLRTAAVSGSGTIRANGGYCGRWDGGGGGRVAVIVTNAAGFGGVTMQAYAGICASGRRGACGTVYTEDQEQGARRGTLKIDANNIVSQPLSTTFIWTNVSDTAVGTVIITNTATLAISNQTLTVQGDWVNRGSFVAYTNATVDFVGATTATIFSNNTFFNFTCTNAGKTLSFEEGRTNTVNGFLKLGASQLGQRVTLQSTTNGSWSYLTLTPGGTQQIARVSVKDNNAGGGQTLLVSVGSVNGGNNINWQFPPSGTIFMVK